MIARQLRTSSCKAVLALYLRLLEPADIARQHLITNPEGTIGATVSPEGHLPYDLDVGAHNAHNYEAINDYQEAPNGEVHLAGIAASPLGDWYAYLLRHLK